MLCIIRIATQTQGSRNYITNICTHACNSAEDKKLYVCTCAVYSGTYVTDLGTILSTNPIGILHEPNSTVQLLANEIEGMPDRIFFRASRTQRALRVCAANSYESIYNYAGRACVEALTTCISREQMGVRAREWHQTEALALSNADVPIIPHVCLAVLVGCEQKLIIGPCMAIGGLSFHGEFSICMCQP